MNKFKVSIIIAVLESYEVVRRQMIHYAKWLPNYPVEFILVDDGSEPAIKDQPFWEDTPGIRWDRWSAYKVWTGFWLFAMRFVNTGFHLSLIETNDVRPWTQPCARNIGAKHARGELLLFTDIDHFFTEECIQAVMAFKGDKMMFRRKEAALGEEGELITDEKSLVQYGAKPGKVPCGMHYNTFAIRKTVFDELKGYDSKFCGKYGGDDTDFSDRYGALHRLGRCRRHEVGPAMYVYPDPKYDRARIFHHLRWPK